MNDEQQKAPVACGSYQELVQKHPQHATLIYQILEKHPAIFNSLDPLWYNNGKTESVDNMNETPNLEEVLEHAKTLIGTTIKEARETKNISMNALAKITGVTQPTIFNIEAGKRWTYIPIYMKICQALDLTIYDLLVFLDGEESLLLTEEDALLLSDMRKALLKQRQMRRIITETNQNTNNSE